jgi:hypothetical protein
MHLKQRQVKVKLYFLKAYQREGCCRLDGRITLNCGVALDKATRMS